MKNQFSISFLSTNVLCLQNQTANFLSAFHSKFIVEICLPEQKLFLFTSPKLLTEDMLSRAFCKILHLDALAEPFQPIRNKLWTADTKMYKTRPNCFEPHMLSEPGAWGLARQKFLDFQRLYILVCFQM